MPFSAGGARCFSLLQQRCSRSFALQRALVLTNLLHRTCWADSEQGHELVIALPQPVQNVLPPADSREGSPVQKPAAAGSDGALRSLLLLSPHRAQKMWEGVAPEQKPAAAGSDGGPRGVSYPPGQAWEVPLGMPASHEMGLASLGLTHAPPSASALQAALSGSSADLVIVQLRVWLQAATAVLASRSGCMLDCACYRRMSPHD